MKLEIKKFGNATGLVLPVDLLARLGLQQGDEVFITYASDQSFKVSRYDDRHAEAMRIARAAMHEYRDALKGMAK